MINTMVCFRTSTGSFAVPVGSTRAVRSASGLVPLPEQRVDIAGVLPGQPPITVLAILGAGGEFVLVLTSGSIDYGLQVLEVKGVERVDNAQVGPAPYGQDRTLITGTLYGSDDLVLILDPDKMATRL